MGEATESDQRAGGIADIILAPLHWLERSRGRRRLGLILAYMVVVLLVAGAVWWTTSLNGLPDIGDPFDVAAFRASVAVPPDEDAFTLYREAFERLDLEFSESERGKLRNVGDGAWSGLDRETRHLVESNREAIDLWLRASARDRAQAVTDGKFGLAGVSHNQDTYLQSIRLFDVTLMGLLEGGRREEAGDLGAAWDHNRAALRASRHIGMGGTPNHRSMASILATHAMNHVSRWSQRPGLDASLLRRALDDALAAAAMTPPNSDAIKADYLGLIDALEHPEIWLDFDRESTRPGRLGPLFTLFARNSSLFAGATFLWREPERSIRVFRIMYAHWLSQCDLTPGQMIPMVSMQVRGSHTHPDFPYATPPTGLDAAHPLPADKLYDRYASTLYGQFLCPPLSHYQQTMQRDRRVMSSLILALAERLYAVEHGGEPERGADLIATGYLDRMPEGFEDLEDPAGTELTREPAPEN